MLFAKYVALHFELVAPHDSQTEVEVILAQINESQLYLRSICFNRSVFIPNWNHGAFALASLMILLFIHIQSMNKAWLFLAHLHLQDMMLTSIFMLVGKLVAT